MLGQCYKDLSPTEIRLETGLYSGDSLNWKEIYKWIDAKTTTKCWVQLINVNHASVMSDTIAIQELSSVDPNPWLWANTSNDCQISELIGEYLYSARKLAFSWSLQMAIKKKLRLGFITGAKQLNSGWAHIMQFKPSIDVIP